MERDIYCKEEQLKDVLMVLDVNIPNDYYVFVNNYRVNNTYDGGRCVTIDVDTNDDWVKIKKIYFPNYKKRSLPGSIILK